MENSKPIQIEFVWPGYPQSIIRIKGKDEPEMMVQSERLMKDTNEYNFINVDKIELLKDFEKAKAKYHDWEQKGKFILNVGLEYELFNVTSKERFCLISSVPDKEPFFFEGETIIDIKKALKNFNGNVNELLVYKLNNDDLPVNRLEVEVGKNIIAKILEKGREICKASLLSDIDLEQVIKINRNEHKIPVKEVKQNDLQKNDKYITQLAGSAIKIVEKTGTIYQLLVNETDQKKCLIYKYKFNRKEEEFYNLSIKALKNPINKVTHVIVDSLYHKKGIEDIFAEVALRINKNKITSLKADKNGYFAITVSKVDKKSEIIPELKAQDFKVFVSENKTDQPKEYEGYLGTGLYIAHDKSRSLTNQDISKNDQKKTKITSNRLPSVQSITDIDNVSNKFKGGQLYP